jgi:hypothetical protein
MPALFQRCRRQAWNATTRAALNRVSRFYTTGSACYLEPFTMASSTQQPGGPKPADASSGGLSSSWFYCLALALEALVFHWRVLFVPGYIFPWDFRAVHLPLATFVADSLRAGQFPLWDPYTFCGNPIFANIQTALFYPPVFLSSLLAAWIGDGALPKILVISVVAQVVFAGITTFFLLRRLGVSTPAAWIGGTVFELGCFFAAHPQHMGAMQAAECLRARCGR